MIVPLALREYLVIISKALMVEQESIDTSRIREQRRTNREKQQEGNFKQQGNDFSQKQKEYGQPSLQRQG